jgi:uncharacterized protein (DUF302 family)
MKRGSCCEGMSTRQIDTADQIFMSWLTASAISPAVHMRRCLLVVIKRSTSSYEETAGLLIDAIERRGLTVFARIDHAAGARSVGMELADEEVVIFGSPQSGTPLMQSDPEIGIELPLRILLWRNGEEVLTGYRDPRALSGMHDVSGQQAILEKMAALLESLVGDATS